MFDVSSKAGLRPVVVVASAGDVHIGAVDPIQEIGQIAASHNMWFHVDAAYGGIYILCDEGKQSMAGIDIYTT